MTKQLWIYLEMPRFFMSFATTCYSTAQALQYSSLFKSVDWSILWIPKSSSRKQLLTSTASLWLPTKKRVADAGRESDLPPSLPISWPNDDVAASLILMCSMSRYAWISELFINIFNFFEVCNWAKHFLLLYTKSFFIVKINHQNIKQ